MKTSMHRPTKCEAKGAARAPSVTWLDIKDARGNEVTLFMPLEQAEAMKAAFDDYENWLSSQEGPTYDEALAAKCDAQAREDEARKLKGMT